MPDNASTMSAKCRRASLVLLAGWMVASLVCVPPRLAAQSPSTILPAQDGTELARVLEAHASELAAVTTEGEAAALFTSRLAAALGIKETAALINNPASLAQVQDKTLRARLTDAPIRLTADLAAWRLATALKQAADTDDHAAWAKWKDDAVRQRSWLLDRQERHLLRRALTLVTALDILPSPPSDAAVDAALAAEYATYLDQTYPHLRGPEPSWTALAERDGADGLRRRLMEFWERTPQSAADKATLAARYYQMRIRPVLVSEVTALAIRAEAEAEQRATAEWRGLRSWKDQVREARGLVRLCGTWAWTMHNHQNHQEQKFVLTLVPPDAPDSGTPRPSRIVVMGDAVYLRWEFSGAIQEDSLLLSGEDRRLEGTFVNSAGPFGSITAKRIAPCPKQ
jgi:hypothetical protein